MNRMHRTVNERLKRIQQKLGVEPDGVLGPETLSALEKVLFDSADSRHTPTPETPQLRLSSKGVDSLIRCEIGSTNYYNTTLSHPTWPGGDSGITIGIGYDLGYQTPSRLDVDWRRYLKADIIEQLKIACGKKGRVAKALLQSLNHISIPYNTARSVFVDVSLPRYAALTKRIYPGIEDLYPDAQAALVSLVYNRGSSLTGDNRKEMKAICRLVKARDYAGIAQKIHDMKRLWHGRNLDGLIKRRDEEAALVAESDHKYFDNDILFV